MDEFSLISEFFDRRQKVDGLIVGIGDDGAVTATGEAHEVHVFDTLVQDVHFPHDAPAADIAWRAVAVNLSDIAAMGATPRWMTLGLTLPHADEEWLRHFSEGLFAVADEFDVSLIGGDTTRGPVVVASVAMVGEALQKPLLRSGANVGDTVYVTGTLGDAAGGLAQYKSGEPDEYLLRRFLRPSPRVDIGPALVGTATAAIDISDGLAGDLRKLLEASGVGAEIDLYELPLSTALQEQFDPEQCQEFALTGGDDYELCFTAPPGLGMPGTTAIGTITDSRELICRQNGRVVDIDSSGYSHFDG